MQIPNGVIFLVQPVFARRQLTGEATVGPTWVEYTFSAGQVSVPTLQALSLDDEAPRGCRVLIPLTNVKAIAIVDDAQDQANRHEADQDRSLSTRKGGDENHTVHAQ